jgi:C1A family cysteine protease
MKILNFIKKLFWFWKPTKKQPQIKFGWKRDTPDPRDFKFKIVSPHALPPLVDLRQKCPPVYNQTTLGSCVGNSVAGAFQFEQIKQNKPNWIPSRLFIYYGARALEGTVNEDAGCLIRDAIKVVAGDGVCPEKMWQYIESKYKLKPTPECYTEALNNQVLEYLRISPHTLYEVKHCLSDGYPVICGIMLYNSFMSEEIAKTGIIKMPKPNEELLGGHAICLVGYNDDRKMFIARNSWGTEWGMKGYFEIPFDYISGELASDFWTLRVIESENK